MYHSSDWQKLGKEIMANDSKNGGKRDPSHCWWEFQLMQPFVEAVWNIYGHWVHTLQTINYLYNQLYKYPRKTLSAVLKKKLTSIFMAICFMIVKTRKSLVIHGKGNEKQHVIYSYVRIVHIGQKKKWKEINSPQNHI